MAKEELTPLEEVLAQYVEVEGKEAVVAHLVAIAGGKDAAVEMLKKQSATVILSRYLPPLLAAGAKLDVENWSAMEALRDRQPRPNEQPLHEVLPDILAGIEAAVEDRDAVELCVRLLLLWKAVRRGN